MEKIEMYNMLYNMNKFILLSAINLALPEVIRSKLRK